MSTLRTAMEVYPYVFHPITVLGAGLLALVPLLMWARVRTGAHTRGQVWAGATLGLALPYVQLTALLHFGVI